MKNQHTVLVIGSGITGLMTAYYANLAGYSVRLISKSPAPRQAAAGTKFESSTWDGYVMQEESAMMTCAVMTASAAIVYAGIAAIHGMQFPSTLR